MKTIQVRLENEEMRVLRTLLSRLLTAVNGFGMPMPTTHRPDRCPGPPDCRGTEYPYMSLDGPDGTVCSVCARRRS